MCNSFFFSLKVKKVKNKGDNENQEGRKIKQWTKQLDCGKEEEEDCQLLSRVGNRSEETNSALGRLQSRVLYGAQRTPPNAVKKGERARRIRIPTET